MFNFNYTLNYINLCGYLLICLWVCVDIFIKKTLKYKGLIDLKSLVLLETMQLLCYIPLSILSRALTNDLELWAIFWFIVSSLLFCICPCVISLSIPRLNLRNISKQPRSINIIFWTILEISSCILYISFIYVLFQQANVQYNISLPALNYCLEYELLIAKNLLIYGSPLWIVMLLQSYRMQRLTNKYKTITDIKSNDAPILYLRAFGLDSTPAMNLKTFDECIFNNANETVVISLANPNEIIPSGGSIKIQSTDDAWKDTVKTLLQQTRAVIMVLGDTEGLKWEISQLKKYIQPSQLFVVIPSYYYLSLAWGEYSDSKSELLPDYNSNATKNLSHCISFFASYKKNIKKFHNLWCNFSEELNKEGYYIEKEFPGFNKIITFNSCWESTCDNIKYKGKDILFFILEKTDKDKKCDYRSLSDKIKKYEVNGFVPDNFLKHYRTIINKILRLYGLIALTISSLVFVIVFFDGWDLFFSNKDFRNFMDPDQCEKAYSYCIKHNDYKAFEHLMSKSYVSLTVMSDTCPAYKKGMKGEYVLLEYGDWNQDSLVSIKDKVYELYDKPKKILVMKDSIVLSYYFESNLGVNIQVKGTYEGEKKFINKTYKRWKDNSK